MTTRGTTVDSIYTRDIQDQHGFAGDRIRAAVDKAREAFWESICESFPEVETGDMAPGDDLPLETGSNAAVLAWLMWNSPHRKQD